MPDKEKDALMELAGKVFPNDPRFRPASTPGEQAPGASELERAMGEMLNSMLFAQSLSAKPTFEHQDMPNDGTHDVPENIQLEILELELIEAFVERTKDMANLHSMRLF